MLWIGSGRFDGRIGDGDGPRACRGPDAGIETHGKVRPGVPTGTVTRVEKPQAQLPVATTQLRPQVTAKVSVAVSI